MKRILFLWLLFIFFQQLGFGQQQINSKIILRGITGVSGDEFFLFILPQMDSTKIIYKIKKGFKSAEFDVNPEIIKARFFFDSLVNISKKLDVEDEKVKFFIKKMDSISITYTIYNVDSLTITNANHQNYLKLFGEVLNAKQEMFGEDKRIILDETSMTFSLINKGVLSKVWVRSPSSTSHPILYNLIAQTNTLYRKAKQNNFLNQGNLRHY